MTIILDWSSTVDKNPLEVALLVNKRVWNAVLGCNLINDSMISVHFQGKSFNITVTQVYAPNTSAEKAEVDWLYEHLPTRPFTTNTKKDVFLIKGLAW